MAFRFKDADPPASYCTALAGAMRDYPPQHVLDHAYCMDDYRPGACVRSGAGCISRAL
jgi:secreted Zn-dependent insulinase-like peptidase